jgi:lactoylglutathione lyase
MLAASMPQQRLRAETYEKACLQQPSGGPTILANWPVAIENRKAKAAVTTVIPITRLFEAHIIVRDLQRSIVFYRDVLGLQLGIEQPERPAAFFWVGGPGKSMLGIFTLGSWPTQMMQHHLSFQVKLEDLLAVPQKLQSVGISPKGRRTRNHPTGEPTDEPIVFAWMPAASIFFDDPDGNLLEYITMLPDSPRPELGIVQWSEWNAGHSARVGSSSANTVTPVEQLFEDHISIRDLERSLGFYRDILGMEVGLLQSQSREGMGGALLWVGGRGRSMLGLYSLGSTWPLTIMQHHTAFEVAFEDLLTAPRELRAAGVIAVGGKREPIEEPVVFTWMPAASVFFDDPDGNLLEYIAMLDDKPRPELGLLLSWSEWQSARKRPN